ncbi:MAG: hypothetical protein ACO3P0_14045 [Quisquiliibacterium sp.]|jgi:hypothetical protein
MKAVERHVADTETDAYLKRVKESIRASGAMRDFINVVDMQ